MVKLHLELGGVTSRAKGHLKRIIKISIFFNRKSKIYSTVKKQSTRGTKSTKTRLNTTHALYTHTMNGITYEEAFF